MEFRVGDICPLQESVAHGGNLAQREICIAFKRRAVLVVIHRPRQNALERFLRRQVGWAHECSPFDLRCFEPAPRAIGVRDPYRALEQ
jgi:hypothetical protein